MSPPQILSVEMRVYTNEFRVYGLLHVRPNVGTAWLLNSDDRPHVSLTRVSMFRAGVAHPPAEGDLMYESHFAAIPKSSIVWAAGGAMDQAGSGLGLQPREVFLVYPTYVLAGTFAMRPEVRLSDFVGTSMGHRSFVTLSHARVLDRGPSGASLAEAPVLHEYPFVTVDIRKVAAVIDVRNGDPARAYQPGEPPARRP